MTQDVFDIPPLRLVFSTGTSAEKDIKELLDYDPELKKLLMYITSRKIIIEATWTKYRKQKLALLLDKICSLDDDSYTMHQILHNAIVVHWNNENVNTIYRLIY